MASDFRITMRRVDGMPVRVADGGGSASQRLVLTSPWPESLFAFERAWDRMAIAGHLLAIDLPGFGRSELREDLLTPEAMGAFLIRLLDAWDIEQPHLICPDIGTTAALFAAAKDPTRIRSLVVGCGAAAYPLEVSGVLRDLIRAPDIESFRAQDPRELVRASMSALGTAVPSQAAIEDYVESNGSGRFAEAARYVRTYPDQLPVLRDLLPGIFTPTLIIAGRDDQLVPPANAEYLDARLPNSRLEVLEAGHFVWEEAAEQYASLIAAWVNGGYLMPIANPAR